MGALGGFLILYFACPLAQQTIFAQSEMLSPKAMSASDAPLPPKAMPLPVRCVFTTPIIAAREVMRSRNATRPIRTEQALPEQVVFFLMSAIVEMSVARMPCICNWQERKE